jgi:integrase
VLDRHEYEQLLLAKAEIMMRGAVYASSTRRFYAENWATFQTWCERAGRSALPACQETVALYLTELMLSGKKLATVRRHSTSIRHQHLQNGLESPTAGEVKRLLKGAQRMRCERPVQKAPVTLSLLCQMLTALKGPGERVARNRAILEIGFASALRRRSLCNLDLCDVGLRERGILLQIKNEKQDRRGLGRVAAVARGSSIETCPVVALENWLKVRGSTAGPLFTPVFGKRAMSGRLHPVTIAYVVKQAARDVGLDPAEFGGHSLRAGFVTQAFENGVNEIVIAQHTAHRSLASLRRYLRQSDPFRGNPSSMIGL